MCDILASQYNKCTACVATWNAAFPSCKSFYIYFFDNEKETSACTQVVWDIFSLWKNWEDLTLDLETKTLIDPYLTNVYFKILTLLIEKNLEVSQ